MKPFLQKIAEEIADRYGDDPGSTCVVLPNRRAALYLRKYLSESLKKTSWAPQMFSVEDFITGLSRHSIIDPAGLLFELYGIHKEIAGKDAQEFELFADWGQVLLKDFDEIDQYLADPEKVFTFLDETRALAVWNLGERPLTEQEQNYIRFYQSFKVYYFRLKERLLRKGRVYQGLAYRIAAENIEEVSTGLPYRKIFFAGLNALATAEERIIDHLHAKGRAEIYWDADEYYIKDKGQEAGDFIRQHLQKWPSSPVKWLEKEFRESEKEIRIFGIPKGTGQAIKAGQIIRQEGGADILPDKTAIVLADESLLLPVLYSLPEESGPVNVTMGFPFRYTNLYQMVYLLFQLHENAERFASGEEDSRRKYYARDILKILSHPFLFLWCEKDSPGDDPDLLADTLRKKNRVFLNSMEVLSLASNHSDSFRSVLGQVFSDRANPGEFMTGLLATLESIRKRMSIRVQLYHASHELDFEFLFHLSRVIRRSKRLLEDYPYISTLRSLKKVLFQVLDMSRLPFYGEPLKGLQVMGVLETRAIDFENLIVLSVNEGILPSGRSSNSFIPFDIKQVFGLPTFQQRDAVFAFHFYRMLQRAKNIYLLYDTEGDMMKGGEKSRFITQITYELKKYNDKIKITEELLSPSPPSGRSAGISMPKTQRVMQALGDKSARGFSPSALNLYIRCPLQFYFQEVMGISESEEIEETIESKTLGTVIHDVLYRMYQPFTGKFVEPGKLLEQLKNTEEYLDAAFREHYRDGDLEHGKNHLAYKVSQFLVNQLIRSESERLGKEARPGDTLFILALEEKLESIVECRSGEALVNARVKGKADRIDRWGQATRVIDYKTGSVKAEELRVKSWDTLATDPKMAKAFQLLVYAYLHEKQNPVEDGFLHSGNISLRKISEDVMEVKLPGEQPVTKENLEIFEKIMIGVLEDILDPGIAFSQTDDLEICSYCPFKAICCR